MGRNLFIRVSAATYSEEAVRRDWPGLCLAVWPEDRFDVLPHGKTPFGVMDLLRELVENGALLEDKARARALAPFLPHLAQLLEAMETALGDRDVQKAHALTDDIENALDAAEKAQPKP